MIIQATTAAARVWAPADDILLKACQWMRTRQLSTSHRRLNSTSFFLPFFTILRLFVIIKAFFDLSFIFFSLFLSPFFSLVHHLTIAVFLNVVYLQAHWLNRNFPCSQFMHKNLAWRCDLASVHGALIESKAMRSRITSSDRRRQCQDRIATRCVSEKPISFAGEW